jgi:hypothetical protein
MSACHRKVAARTIAVVLIAAATSFGSAPLNAQTPPLPGLEVDPIVGVWDLDVAASTFKPGPPPKSELRVYEAEHEGIKATVVTIYADGRKTVFEYVTSYNDVTSAVTGSQTSDAIRMRRVDTYTSEAVLSLAGRVVGQTRRVIARDGRTMTISLQRTEPVVVNDVIVYRRR